MEYQRGGRNETKRFVARAHSGFVRRGAAMLGENIEAFLIAARHGSFARAARELYLTPNAVKKRVLTLERQCGVTLFERSNRGLALTPAGASLRDDLQVISRQVDRAVAEARALQERRAGAVWFGMTDLFTEEFLSSRWPGVDRLEGAAQTRIVHYGASATGRDEMLRDVGVRIDLCVDLYEPALAEPLGLRVTETSRFRLCIAAATGAAGSGEPLRLDQIEQDVVALLPVGRSTSFDAVRARLERERPDVSLVDVGDYGVRSLEELRSCGRAVIAPENVAGLYPHLTFSPLVGAPPVSFGVYAPPALDGAAAELVAELVSARNF